MARDEAILRQREHIRSMPRLEGYYTHWIHIPLEAIGKPRMTRRDAWSKRPAVKRYNEWKDRFRAATKMILNRIDLDLVTDVSWIAVFAIPPSLTRREREARAGKPHTQKPDRDNIDKAILDTLFHHDEGIADGTLRKRWAAPGEEPCILLRLSIPDKTRKP